mmetsp:Transcript_17287/g.12349  ORF Transcript_17287/g.12349 Transcript_17287/m.12349 type:complete len:86 (+) Transcript_17287:455-712(+)
MKELEGLKFKEGERSTFFEENDFRTDPKNCLVYLNEDVIKKQRGVVGHIIKKLGSNLIQGKSLIDITLPIKIFEPKSFLEKLAFM